MLEDPQVPPIKGVRFQSPPPNLRARVDELVATALDVDGIEPGELVFVGVSTNAGWNTAVVLKTEVGFSVEGFIGSNWGTRPAYGFRIQHRVKLGRK